MKPKRKKELKRLRRENRPDPILMAKLAKLFEARIVAQVNHVAVLPQLLVQPPPVRWGERPRRN